MTLLYDGQCPFCSRYGRATGARLKDEIEAVDARRNPEVVSELRADGYDMNDGTVLLIDGLVLQGRDAVAALESMGGARSPAGRTVRALTKLPGFLRVVYPGVRIARLGVLRALGRDPRIAGEP